LGAALARDPPERELVERDELARLDVEREVERPVDFLADARVGAGRRFVVTTVRSRVVLVPAGIGDTPGTNWSR
jgi:hypothetical protein